MKRILILIYLISVKGLTTSCLADPLINLQDYDQDIVVDTKRILLDEFPYAFNPSIIRIEDKILLSFRVIPDPKNAFCSYIGLVWLNDQLIPISKPQVLTLRTHSSAPSRCEDGRLIMVDNKLFLVYSDNEEKIISKGGFRMYLAEIGYTANKFEVKSIEKLASFEGNDLYKREKNWAPFEYKNTLLLAYSIHPHKIFEPILGTGTCKSVVVTHNTYDWPWGEVRGGTGALLDEDHYLAFFHSFKQMYTVHAPAHKYAKCYCIGAYIFSAKPPFKITHMSPQPIVGKNFYEGEQYKPYWGTVVAVFPCGFIFDGDHILVAYGRQDHEMWIAKLDKKKLYESLVPVN